MPLTGPQRRALYTRAGGADITMNTPDGWMTDWRHGPIPWAAGIDADDMHTPSWWCGSDDWDRVVQGQPIGPNGPWLDTRNSILPAVTRCTEVIVNAVVRTPWRWTVGGQVTDAPLWARDPMLLGNSPGPVGALAPGAARLPGFGFWATWLTHALWWGLGAFVFIESADGSPLPGSLRIVNPYLVSIDRDSGEWVIDGGGTEKITTVGGRFIAGGKTWRLAVLRGLTPHDGIAPEGVLSRHFATLRIGAAVTSYVAGTFRSGVPAGYLKVTQPGLDQASANRLKEAWMRSHGRGRRSIAVLNATTEFHPISISPVDAAASELVRANRVDVAHAFNLSAVWLDEGTSGLTYQNATDRRGDLVDISLSGWGDSVAAVLSSLMPYGSHVDIDWQQFTQGNLIELVPALVSAVQAGLITPLEARQRLGLAPRTGPDPAWTPMSTSTEVM
jgi:HK97 family phage portal protein